MKKVVALLLALLCCLSLLSCDRTPKQDDIPPNTTREEGFPESAEVLYDTVEGTRIPFKSLGVLRAGTQDSQMLVLRSADEVNTAIEQGYFSFIGEEGKALLLSKNYDLYQIVAVRYTGGDPYREVAELVVSGGALEVVRVRYIHPLGHYADVHYDEYALCLVQKSDINIPASSPFSLHLIEHLIELPHPSSSDVEAEQENAA